MVENAGNVDSLKHKAKVIYSLTLSETFTIWHISFQSFSKCFHTCLFFFLLFLGGRRIVIFTVCSFYIVLFATSDAVICRSGTYQSPQSLFSSQNQANGKNSHFL